MPRCATNQALLKPKPDHRISVTKAGAIFGISHKNCSDQKFGLISPKFSGFSSDLTFSPKNRKNPKKSNFSAGPENFRTFGANSRTFGANSRTFREIPARFGKISRTFRFSGVFSLVSVFFRDFSDFAISQRIGGHTLQNCKAPNSRFPKV